MPREMADTQNGEDIETYIQRYRVQSDWLNSKVDFTKLMTENHKTRNVQSKTVITLHHIVYVSPVTTIKNMFDCVCFTVSVSALHITSNKLLE